MTAESRSAQELTRVLVIGAGGFVGQHLLTHLQEETATPLHITATVLPGSPNPPAPFPTSPRSSAGKGENSTLYHAGVSTLTPIPLPGREREDSPFPVSAANEVGKGAGGLGESTLTLQELDICDMKAVEALVADARPHHIYHLAARASGADTDRDAVFQVNVTGTRNVLEAAANLSPFPRVLVISTGYVYGETDPERPAREEDPIGPLWRYGSYTDSKIEMESVARSYRGFVVVARSFAHTGPGQEPRFVVPSFARQIARIERGQESPEIQVGNLDARRDLLDVRDVVRAYRLLMRHAPPGETFNIALGRPVSMFSVLEQLRALSSVPTEVLVDPARLRPADIACSTGDASRLRALTGWQPSYSLETTLRDTLDFWRNVTD
jgi:GDP-4-dehydro-6-deoxy-D-mannose reductase